MADLTICLAFPVAESIRVFLRSLSAQPLPSLYRTGAQNAPCSQCGMTLNVGPRILQKLMDTDTATLVCPLCLPYVAKQAGYSLATEIESLGNPEAGWEGERKDQS